MLRPRFPLAPVALASALALFTVFATPANAQAQAGPAAAGAARQVNVSIAAQPLGQALNELARQARLELIAAPDLVAGKTAPAVAGQFSVREALNRLLAGSGLAADVEASNVFIRRVREDGNISATLAPVTVTAQAERSGTTEGTGSYTTGVTSTATKMNLSIRETPQSISVVTRQRMDDQNLASITEVLEQTPGITITRDSEERFSIYSRGSEITKYQYDGLTTHVEGGTQNMTQHLADMAIYDRIEVVRGATGLMTGAGNVSGMVNMTRKRPTRDFQASLSGGVGSWNDYRGQVDISSPLTKSGKLRARLVAAKQENDSFIDYYNQKRDVLYGVVEADITDTTTLRFGADYQKYQSSGGAGVPSLYTDGGQTNFSRSTSFTSKNYAARAVTTNYFFNVDQSLANGWKLGVAGNYMDVDRKLSNNRAMTSTTNAAINRETGEFNAGPGNTQLTPLNQKSASINLQGPFSLFGREHNAIFGHEFSRYQSRWENYGSDSRTANLATLHELPPAPTSRMTSSQDYYILQRGYYGALHFNPVDRLKLILGARISDYEFRTAWNGSWSGYRKSGEVTPYAGLVYDLTPQQSIYVSYTDIFLPNNVVDINRQVIDPQVGSNYEAGWKGEFYDGRLNANVAIYQRKTDNATEIAGYHDTGEAYYRAVDGVKAKGIDIEISGEVLPSWNVSGSYSHTRSEDADGNRLTLNHPLDTVKLWNTYKFSGGLQGLTIGGGARWISKTSAYRKFFAKNLVQDDYVVVDLMAGYKLNQHLSVTLNIGNLFDKKYYSSLNTTARAYYGEPRNVRLNMRYDF